MRSTPIFVSTLIISLAPPVYAEVRPNGSTVAVDPLGRGVWVVDEERRELALMAENGDVTTVAVGAWPEQLAVLDDGTVFVSCRSAGTIDVISPAFETTSIQVGGEPRALAIDDAGEQVYAGLVTGHAVVRIDARAKKVLARRALTFSPYTIALTSAGVAVAGTKDDSIVFLPRTLDSGPAPVVTLAMRKKSTRRPWHIQALATDQDELFVVHANVDTGTNEPAFGGGYGGEVSEPLQMALSAIRTPPAPGRPALLGHVGELDVKDVQGAVIRDRLLFLASRATKQVVIAAIESSPKLELSPSEALNLGHGTSGLAFSPDGSLFSLVAFERRLAKISVREGAHDLLFSGDHRLRGTNSMALDHRREHFPLRSIATLAMRAGQLDEELALGRRLFHDALNRDLSSGQTACISCHPDGREDGLVWRLGATLRQTPMLAGRAHGTAPFNWLGTTDTLERNIIETVHRLGGNGASDQQARALARYIVEGLPKPELDRSKDQVLLARGEQIFHDAAVACSSCHQPEKNLTDGMRWDVESTSETEKKDISRSSRFVKMRKKEIAPTEYDTPSLKYVALTAPYFHDGSARTLEELIASNADRMGSTSHLGEDDRRALVAYLSSL